MAPEGSSRPLDPRFPHVPGRPVRFRLPAYMPPDEVREFLIRRHDLPPDISDLDLRAFLDGLDVPPKDGPSD